MAERDLDRLRALMFHDGFTLEAARSVLGDESIGSSVASIFRVVVFPAPFGPRTPRISP